MTERLPFHFSLSCVGEGNDNPLHCSFLENPRDGGAWWAAVCGGRTESDTTEATQQQQQQESFTVLFPLFPTLHVIEEAKMDVQFFLCVSILPKIIALI